MGRRQRRRSADHEQLTPAEQPASRIARVRVDERTWLEFKAAIGPRPVSEVLGSYVEQEVVRARAERLRTGDLTAEELLEALDRAAETTRQLGFITQKLERLRREQG